MPVITADAIRKSILVNDALFVPGGITKAISQALACSVEDVSAEIEHLVALYREYITCDGPTPVNYSSDATIDAYTIHYLPRNTLVPKLLFLSLAYHPTLRAISDEVNILDLGSGTGGIVLGLLDLFKVKPFSDIKANITSCDISRLALDRQKELITRAGYQHDNIRCFCVDLADAWTYDRLLSKLAPYDYIIAANLLAELPQDHIALLLSKLPGIMAPNAVVLFADPPRTYIDRIKVYVSRILRSLGLFHYYPCPPGYECKKLKCPWVWLNVEFTCPGIEINGDLLKPNKLLLTTWSVFCSSNHSIYDALSQLDPSLTWGVAVPFGDEFSTEETLDYSLCTTRGTRKIRHIRRQPFSPDEAEVIRRGSIVGFNDDFSKVFFWHPAYGLEQIQ